MQYSKICPAGEILHSVESYVFLKAKKPESIKDVYFPNGKPGIIFHFKDPFCLLNETGQWVTMPSVSFVGCQAMPISLKNEGDIDSLTILLHPCSLYNLFRVSVVGNIRYKDANQYFPEEFLTRLTDCSLFEERADMLDQFFSGILNNYYPEQDLFKALCDYIIQNKGQVGRKTIAERFSISENYIHKLFIKKIGISFKPYARVVRISNIMEDIYHNDSHDWISLLLQYGFFDQTHFINDFKKITGKTPHQYYKSDKVISSILSCLA